MPRRNTTTTADPDTAALDGIGDLPADPAPAAPKRPRGRPPGSTTKTGSGRAASVPKMSRAEMVDAVKGQVMMVLLPLAAAWEMRDPCAEVLSDVVNPRGDTRLEAIVDRLMVMVARNASVLEFMAKNTLLLDAGMLMTLVAPIWKKVWSAHGPTGAGHATDEQELTSGYERDFPPYSPTGRAPAFAG